jgi:hypothetical protein
MYTIQQIKRNPPRPAPARLEAPSAAEALLAYARQQRADCQALQPYGAQGAQALIGTNQRGWRQYTATPA